MKIVESVRRGVSKSETAHRFGVSLSSVKRYLKQLEEEGSLAPKKKPGSSPKLDEKARKLLEADLEERPAAPPIPRGASTLGRCSGSR
jgi:transposase